MMLSFSEVSEIDRDDVFDQCNKTRIIDNSTLFGNFHSSRTFSSFSITFQTCSSRIYPVQRGNCILVCFDTPRAFFIRSTISPFCLFIL